MTIDEAIELLSDFTYGGVVTFNQDATDAIRLGIEAMEGIKGLRRGHGKALSELLPGETK